MALRDQPYIPLYVQDVLTDEKLALCRADSHGIYLRLLCILHKQTKYGEIYLKQKHKQNESKYENFASILAKQMPFEQKQIKECLIDLDEEDVIQITNDTLRQKRMVKDGELSIIRATAGKKGGSNITKQYGKPGYLYWIGDYSDKNKIGISVNPQNRLYRLRSDLKIKDLEIQDSFKIKDMGKSEDAAHKYFGELMDGEWVIINHEDMKIKFALLQANLKQNTEYDTVNENEDVIEYDNVIKNIVSEFYKFQAPRFKGQLNKWESNERLLDDSCAVIEKLHRIDGFSYDDIILVLRNVVKDNFWQDKIVSLRGLREKSKNGQTKFQNAAAKLLKKNVFDEWEERYGTK